MEKVVVGIVFVTKERMQEEDNDNRGEEEWRRDAWGIGPRLLIAGLSAGIRGSVLSQVTHAHGVASRPLCPCC